MEATADLNREIRPIHMTAQFDTVYFLYVVTEQMEKCESEHEDGLARSYLSLPRSETDAACCSHVSIHSDLNHQYSGKQHWQPRNLMLLP